MEAFESSEGVHTSAGARDKAPRGATVVKMLIDNALPGIQVDSHLLPQGVSEIQVYKKSVLNIMSLKRGPEEEGLILRAEEDFEKSIDKEVAEDMGAGTPAVFVRTTRLKADRIKALQDKIRTNPKELTEEEDARRMEELTTQEEEVMEQRKETLQTTGNSPVAEFFRSNLRSPLPFKDVTIVGAETPVPEDMDKAKQDLSMVEALIRTIQTQGLGGAPGADAIAASEARATAAEERLAALEARLDAALNQKAQAGKPRKG